VKYTGSWKLGLQSGKGVLVEKYGEIYRGDFLAGVR